MASRMKRDYDIPSLRKAVEREDQNIENLMLGIQKCNDRKADLRHMIEELEAKRDASERGNVVVELERDPSDGPVH